VSRAAQHQGKGGRRPRVEREDAVGGDAGEQRAGCLLLKPAPRQAVHGTKSGQPEAGHQHGRPGHLESRQDHRRQLVESVGQDPQQPAIRRSISSQSLRRLLYRSFQQHGLAVAEPVGKRRRRMDPGEAEALELEGAKEGRCDGQRMHRRADVVQEPR
jgi:hypothetical protein